MKSTESDVCYFEVDAVFNREPVELLEESTWTAGLRRTGNNTKEEVLCFLEFGDVFSGFFWREPTGAQATILAMSSDIEERMWHRVRIL